MIRLWGKKVKYQKIEETRLFYKLSECRLNSTGGLIAQLYAKGLDEESIAKEINTKGKMTEPEALQVVSKILNQIRNWLDQNETENYVGQVYDETDVFDVAIIGAGPAGLTTAFTVKLKEKFAGRPLSVVVLDESTGGLLNVYPFFGLGMIPLLCFETKSLRERFDYLIDQTKIIRIPTFVTNVRSNKSNFSIHCNNGREIQSRTLVLSIGTLPPIVSKLLLLQNVVDIFSAGSKQNAKEFVADKKVVLIGEGKKKASFLESFKPEFVRSFSLEPKGRKTENYRKIVSFRQTDGQLREIGLETNGKLVSIDCFDVAIIGSECFYPEMEAFRDLRLKIKNRRIQVNSLQETSFKNVFASGDCSCGPLGVGNAVETGQKAGTSVVLSVARTNKKNIDNSIVLKPIDPSISW